MKIAIVIPTIRPESWKRFVEIWSPLFDKHRVDLVTVFDGDKPTIIHSKYIGGMVSTDDEYPDYFSSEMRGYEDCITIKNGAVRNLGFAFVATHLPDVEIIYTLDDDVKPIGDPIQDHIDILSKHVPVSWLSTASEYMRGFPYLIRNEAEVVLSHGVWENVPDLDAPTQLVTGAHRTGLEYPKMPVPKGIYFPMCIMNVAFKRKMLPYMYMAPPAPEMNIGRTDDIYCGILAKRVIDEKGWAAVTGYAKVWHERESNVYKNLNVEAKTIELMETFWKGDESHPYFEIYRDKLNVWQEFINEQNAGTAN